MVAAPDFNPWDVSIQRSEKPTKGGQAILGILKQSVAGMEACQMF